MTLGSEKKINMLDIAKALGVSTSTVSASLNGTWSKRRIKKDTADRVQRYAQSQGYRVNLQARALRTSNSGLIGLILPEHDNRFFSELAQFFSLEARKRGLCPVTVSTDRKSEEEMDTVRDLTRYSIDSLFIVGASAPETISRYCKSLGIPHVFVDQPCEDAPSVVTDNYKGAYGLAEAILKRANFDKAGLANRVYFLGGNSKYHASSKRVAAFKAALNEHEKAIDSSQITAYSYDTNIGELEMRKLYSRLGGLPTGLLINSLSVFEGAARFLVTLSEEELRACSFGCFDYDPLIKYMRFPVQMVRQRHRQLVLRAFDIVESQGTDLPFIMIEPEIYISENGIANSIERNGSEAGSKQVRRI